MAQTGESVIPWSLIALSVLGYFVLGAVYRIYFHPLSKFPGPKLAAVTTWYEGYYDVVHKGRFTFHFGDMHKKYGPIVRIGPNELHILDSSHYNVLYSPKNKLDKYSYFYSMLGNPGALFPTISHDLHKIRRGAIAPFFSSQAIVKFAPRVQKYTDRLCERMRERMAGGEGESIPLFFAYRCLTVDIIAEYVFGKDLGLLERKDWGEDFYAGWRGLWETSPLIRQLPWMLPMMEAMPRWVLEKLNPAALEAIDMQLACAKLTRQVLDSQEAEKANGTAKKEDGSRTPQPILFDLAESDSLPPSEKTFNRLWQESSNVLAAGFETTGGTLAHMTYLILADELVHKKLLAELEEAIPDPENIPNYQVLEKLPYLWAVVKESLRTSVGPYSRLSRVNTKESMRYKDWIIPANSAVGMSSLYIAYDESIFPDAHAFKPERWLEPGARERLEPYLTAFGKGSRMCVGQNLAYAELYSVIASVMRRFPDLVLFDTSPRDVEAVADYFAGMWRYEKGRPGLQVRVKK